MQFEHDFAKGGGLPNAGEDPTGNGGTLPGSPDQGKLELLVQAGFTPLEAIQIYTASGASWLGESNRIGTERSFLGKLIRELPTRIALPWGWGTIGCLVSV